jgi:VCBS repeat-containing protein
VDQTITITINGTNDVPVITNAATQLAGTVTEAGHLDDGSAVAGTATVSGTLSASDVDTGATQNWTLQGVPSTTYGTMALNAATGQWTYSLNNGLAATQALKEGQSVTQTYTARVTDDFGAYVDQTITITINGTNDVPVITNAATQLAGTVTEAGHLDDGSAVAGTATVSGTLSASDVDTGATQNWTLQGVPSTTYGTMALNAATGQWTYSLNNGLAATQALKEGQSVTQTYTARVTDDFGAYVDQTITITINGTNDVPVITNAATQLAGTVTEAGHLDDGSAVAGTATVSGTLSASDVDTGATQNWTLQGVPSTTYGTMALNAATGQWTYSLNNGLAATQALKEGQSVTQTYTARVTDDFGAYVDQTITITINGTNDVPVITNAATQLAGTVTEAGHLDDGSAVAGTATVSGTLSASDVDTGATQNWTLQGVPSTTYGTMALNAATGQWTYSLNNGLAATQALKEGQSVTQTYTARVTDDFGAYVDQTITITINGTNDVPVITNAATQLAGTVTEAGHLDDGSAVAGTATVSGTLSASDVDTGATQNWTLQGVPSTTYGTMALNAATGQWTYSLNNGLAATQALKEGQSVTQTYTARVTDDFGAYVDQTITITINGTNDVPVITNAATQLAGTVTEAGHLDDGSAVAGTATVSGTLSASDVDTGATQNWTLQGVPSTTYGTMALNAATGQWTYSLNNGLAATQALKEGQSVTQTYTARVTDDFGAYVDQTITITINGTNDVPVAVADIVGVTEDAADQIGYSDGTANTTTVGGNVLTNDTDVDLGDTRSVTGVAAGTPATASGNVATGVAGTYGTVTIAADGSYNYKLDNTKPSVQALAQGQKVTDTFTYTITDAQGAISTTTLTVTVTGSNDAPDITVGAGDSVAAGLTETNSGLTASGTLSIFDVDTQDTVAPSVTTVTASGTYAGLGSLSSQVTNAQLLAMLTVSGGELSTLLQSAPNGIGWNFNSGSQAFNFIPAGQTLVLTYNVRATDSSGAANNTDNQAVTITITGTNDGVTINNDIKSMAENANAAARSGNVLTNDIVDPDFGETTIIKSFSVDRNGDGIQDTYTPTAAGTSVTITSASGGTLGVFTMASNGSYSFVPQLANYSGAVPTITYTAGRAGTLADSGTATLNITVTPVSDAPGVTRDAATVITNEDTAVALGLNAPTVTDRIDQNGAAAGDNPERLSVISLTGIPSGVRLLDGTSGDATLFTSTGGTITIRLSDATNLIASPGAATLTMTTAQFEALKLLPAAHSATNFTVTMRVTEYEVDNAGNPLSGVAGVAATTRVVNNVLAVTDPIDLRIAGGNGPHSVTINEDTPLNLTSLLSATFQDLDGSERRDIIIANPVGNGTIFVNGNAVTAGSSYTIAWNAAGNNLETSQAGFPAISITTAPNFSGDLNGITVTLSARDSDSDSPTATPLTLTDSVTLNLFVRPVAGDVTIAPVSTPEDTGVRFLNALSLTDTDGSEAIAGITVNAVPAGWVIRDELGVVVFTGNGAAAYTVPAGEVTNGDFRNYTITPAAHNSTDRSLAIAVQTTDTRIVNGVPVTSTVTTTVNQTITVTAVAERIGTDSNADGTPDLTMNASFNYTTAGAEDQWFALSTNGFDFRTPWTNQDADGSERTFALVTPVLSGGSAIGSQFQYTLGGVTTTLTYTGTALQIPMEALSTVQFKAAPNIAGSFEIQVQALTIDTDPNTGASVQAISGSATLTSLVIAPVADAVTLAVDAPAVGNEDTAIALVIRPTSADPSETFNVTISGIPADAVIHYNGVLQTVTAGAVTIVGFSSALPLTITPPPNSNVDIPLSVSAVSVDTAATLTSVSGATSLPLLVDVRGVADPVTLSVQTLQTTEAVVDGNARRIPLAGAVTSALPVDADGSETVSLTITGIPAGINVTGLTFISGTGASRVWSGTPAEFAAAELLVGNAHFSGTINFSIRAVSTENDGNSLTGPTLPVRIEVAPSPEAVIAAQTTVLEDARTPVNFALQLPLADGNETLHSVWINQADLVGKPFSLFLGATPLAAAITPDGGWYKLTAAQAANVFIQGAANNDADNSFAIRYEVRDPSNDGTLPATTAQFDATHAVVVNAVTDPTVSTNDYDNSQVIGATTTLEVKVTVTQQDDAAAGGVKDIDGSERLLYFIIDNVPVGVSVEGGRYIGNTPGNPNTGRWFLDTPDTPFNAASLEQTIRFALDGTSTQLSNLNQSISIIAHTQDTGGSEQTSTTTWTLRTTPGFIDSEPVPGIPAATITQWAQDPVPAGMAEDAPTPLSVLVDAQISGSSPFAITITGLPPGSVVAGMMQMTIGGQTVWSAQGSGGNASLQAVLAGITITPPPNWNDNQGPFSFSTTLTTYDQGGGRNDASLTLTPPVSPVSDAIDLVTSAVGAAEDAAAAISLTLANPEDGAASQVIGGKVYISVNESGMTANGGVLSVGGVPLVQETNPVGFPPGTYYVVSGVSSVSALALQYQGAANASGTMAYTAYVQGQEAGAANVTTSQITGSVTISPVNDTVTISAPNVTGSEEQRVVLAISVALADSSEAVASITLSNVPDGVLVFTGNGAPGSLAINLGGGNWGLPLVAGSVPTYVALQPPINWSGTISGLQVGVWSGEPGLDKTLTTTSLDVTVNGVADGIGLTPTLSFGNEGQIVALNLNSVMPDSDGSETATLTFKGLGEYASFFAGSTPLTASYVVATDTYTLSGLTSAQVASLGVGQQDGHYDLTVTAFTTDSPGANASLPVSAILSLDISPIVSSPANDILIGTAGSDRLIGGAGSDTLTGGLGADVFAWKFGDQGSPGTPAVDRITDFDNVPGDMNNKLDLRDLLQGENHASGTGNLANFLHFEKSGSDTIVHVSSSGAFSSGYSASNENQTIILQNVDLSAGGLNTDQLIIQDLLNKGRLQTD